MAVIKGFNGMRFSEAAGTLETLTCPPYDIISEEQRLAFLERNGHNVIRLELPKGDEPYAQAGSTLEEWLNNGTLIREGKDSIYIYEEEFRVKDRTMSIKGMIAAVRLEEFEKGIVLPHEETLSKAKTDRLNLMKATGCNFSQIYSLYMDDGGKTKSKLNEYSDCTPDLEFTDDAGVTHRMWIVSNPSFVEKLCGDFADRKLYIADGHHRYETGINYRNYCRENGTDEGADSDYIMMMLVDMENDGLVVFPTHRMVRDLESFDRNALLEKAAESFDITHESGIDTIEARLDAYYKEGKKAYAMYCGGDEWDLLVLKDISVMGDILPDCSKALRELDVSVLHSLVLEKCLGIDKENMAAQVNLTYTRVFDEAIEGVREGKFQCSFILNPTRVEEIRDVAANGEKMPQKSTYFYPKLVTGMVMNKFDL